MAIQLMLLAAPWAWHAQLVPALAAPSRAGVPVAAFVTPELSANPVALIVFGFTSAWTLSITSEPFRKSELVQKGNKMRSMKKEPPKARPRRLSAQADAITNSFVQEYPKKDVELLWSALVTVYGSEDMAVQAARDNPQILNPAYSFCNTILESKKCLTRVMSEEEALEVMSLNPAVLQCGPTLDPLGKAEIMAFARARSVGNSLLPRSLRTPAVAIFFGAIALVVLTTGTDEPTLVAVRDALRPVLGTSLAASFIFTAYSAARSS